MRLLKLLPDNTKIDFVKARFFAFGFDGLLVLISIFALAMYGLNLGIDFTGGVLVEVKAMQSIDIADMRQRVHSLNFAEAQLRYFGGGDCEMPPNSCVLIRVLPGTFSPIYVAAALLLYLPPITGREETVEPRAARPGVSR